MAIACTFCQSKGVVVEMLYSKREKHYICPQCYCIAAKPTREDDYVKKQLHDEVTRLMIELQPSHTQTTVLPAGQARKGASGGGGGRNGNLKGKMQKPSQKQLYERLN